MQSFLAMGLALTCVSFIFIGSAFAFIGARMEDAAVEARES